MQQEARDCEVYSDETGTVMFTKCSSDCDTKLFSIQIGPSITSFPYDEDMGQIHSTYLIFYRIATRVLCRIHL
jgi:hypothetical protein